MDLLLQLPSLPLFPLLRDKDDRSGLGPNQTNLADATGKLLLWTQNKTYCTHILSITSICDVYLGLLSSCQVSLYHAAVLHHRQSIFLLMATPCTSSCSISEVTKISAWPILQLHAVYASRAGVGRKWFALVWKRAQYTWVFVLHSQRLGAI